MTYLAWALVIFLTFLVVPLGAACWIGRHPPVPAERPAAPEPFDLPDTLAGIDPYGNHWTGHAPAQSYGPFPVDTGPMLILSDKMAANVALEREIRQRCAEAEAKIPPRWR